jgi:hypothetical protein
MHGRLKMTDQAQNQARRPNCTMNELFASAATRVYFDSVSLHVLKIKAAESARADGE